MKNLEFLRETARESRGFARWLALKPNFKTEICPLNSEVHLLLQKAQRYGLQSLFDELCKKVKGV